MEKEGRQTNGWMNRHSLVFYSTSSSSNPLPQKEKYLGLTSITTKTEWQTANMSDRILTQNRREREVAVTFIISVFKMDLMAAISVYNDLSRHSRLGGNCLFARRKHVLRAEVVVIVVVVIALVSD